MSWFEEIFKQQQLLTDMQFAYWREHVLFHFNWWFLLIVTILPWVIWWKFVDKTRLVEVLLYGFLIMNIIDLLDVAGVSFSLWSYTYKLIPVVPGLHPAHFAFLPVFYMLVYDRFPKWRSFIVAVTLLAAFNAFIGEPIFIWLGIYKLLNWHYVYSFPLYVLIGVFVKWITGIIKETQARRRTTHGPKR